MVRVGVVGHRADVVEQDVDVGADLPERLAQVVGDGRGERVEVAVRVAHAAGVGEQLVVGPGPGERVADQLGEGLDEVAARWREIEVPVPAVGEDAEHLAPFQQRDAHDRAPADALELRHEAREAGRQRVEVPQVHRLAGAGHLGRRRRVREIDVAHLRGPGRRPVVHDELRALLVHQHRRRVGGVHEWAGDVGEHRHHLVDRRGPGHAAPNSTSCEPGSTTSKPSSSPGSPGTPGSSASVKAAASSAPAGWSAPQHE